MRRARYILTCEGEVINTGTPEERIRDAYKNQGSGFAPMLWWDKVNKLWLRLKIVRLLPL